MASTQVRLTGAPGGPGLTTSAERAAELLLAGGLVAVPTETVYGLAAIASDLAAVARVFEVKGRPADHPLIVHVADLSSVGPWVASMPAAAEALAARWWPGPLTLVLPRSSRVPDEVTGGQDTVAIRVPDHPLTLRVLRLLEARLGVAGVVAPSANPFGGVSPTTAAHVLAGLGGSLTVGDGVLDGGSCRIGLESSIVDFSSGSPRVLRPGAVSLDDGWAARPPNQLSPRPRAPGDLASHYAPAADLFVASDVEELAVLSSGHGVGVLAPAEVPHPSTAVRLAEPLGDLEFAAVLYSALRTADDLGLARVVVLPPPAGPLRPAIMDRLGRAAGVRTSVRPG